jgi:hypothetical protein
MLQRLLDSGIRFRDQAGKKTTSLDGRTFVFTGTLVGTTRAEAKKLVEDRGGRVSSSVSVKTDFLVQGGKPGSKAKKAQDKGVQVLLEEDFMGLLADAKVNGRFTAGDLAIGVGEDLEVDVEVRGPRWVRASRVALFLNGRKVREEKIQHGADAVVKYKERWIFGGPSKDVHLVVIASGPPLDNSYWTPPQDDRYVVGATNPVWIDGDGDGKFSAPGDYARELVAEHGTDGVALAKALRVHDEITVILAAGLFRKNLELVLEDVYSKLQKRSNSELEEFIEVLKASRGEAFRSYAKTLGSLDLLKKPAAVKAEKKK